MIYRVCTDTITGTRYKYTLTDPTMVQSMVTFGWSDLILLEGF